MTRTLEAVSRHMGGLSQINAQTIKAIRIHNYGGSSMPLSYAETRNIVFLKSAVLGRSLLIEKKGKEYEQNNQSY